MKAPERTALSETGAVSGFAGCGRRPSRSGFNTARQLPLRANEWQLSLDNCNQGGTACDTSLQIVARDFYFATIQSSIADAILRMKVLNSLENNKKENKNG